MGSHGETAAEFKGDVVKDGESAAHHIPSFLNPQSLFFLSFASCLLQMLLMIGNNFGEYQKQICGAVLNRRPRGDKLNMWTRDAKDETANKSIGYVARIVERKERARHCVPFADCFSLSLSLSLFSTEKNGRRKLLCQPG